MLDSFCEKLVKLAINYSMKVKKGCLNLTLHPITSTSKFPSKNKLKTIFFFYSYKKTKNGRRKRTLLSSNIVKSLFLLCFQNALHF